MPADHKAEKEARIEGFKEGYRAATALAMWRAQVKSYAHFLECLDCKLKRDNRKNAHYAEALLLFAESLSMERSAIDLYKGKYNSPAVLKNDFCPDPEAYQKAGKAYYNMLRKANATAPLNSWVKNRKDTE